MPYPSSAPLFQSTAWFSGLRELVLLRWRTSGPLLEDHRSWHLSWSTHVNFSSFRMVPLVMFNLYNNSSLFSLLLLSAHQKASTREPAATVHSMWWSGILLSEVRRIPTHWNNPVFCRLLRTEKSWSASKGAEETTSSFVAFRVLSVNCTPVIWAPINLATGASLLDLVAHH